MDIIPPKLADYQIKILKSEKRFTITEACTKSGKAQPLDCFVYTPQGKKKIKELKINETVLTPEGESKIIGIYYQGVKDVYKVTFNDRLYTYCCDEHLWTIEKNKGNTKGLRKDIKIWPLTYNLNYIRNISKSQLRHYSIPKIKSVNFTEKQVSIDPYLLGILIGDGCIGYDSVKLSCSDKEILQLVTDKLPKKHRLKHERNYDYRIAIKHNATKEAYEKLTLSSALKDLGLMNKKSHEKFIPEIYKYNSLEIRLSILRGILDSDGFVDKRGQACIEQTSYLLSKDIEEIVLSLGGLVKTTLRKDNGYKKNGVYIQGKPVYRQIILYHDCKELFLLNRKKEKCIKKKKPINRNFKSIEYVGKKECACISIEDKKGLYLTDNLIVTHNTFSHLWWLFRESHLPGYPEGANFWWVAPIYEQAEIAFKRIALKVRHNNYYKINLSKLLIQTPLNTIIRFKSADKPDGLYGEDVYAAVFDEYTRAKYEAWVALRSTLTATEGKCKLIGNFISNSNWGHQLSKFAEEENSEYEYFKITAWDAVKAGILSEKEVLQAKKDLHEVEFNALYLAKGSIDNNRLINDEKINDIYTNSYVSNIEEAKYLSCDLAREGSDKFIIFVWNGLRVIDYIKIEKNKIDEIPIIIKEVAEKYKVPKSNICYDSDGIGTFKDTFMAGTKPIINNSRALLGENYENLKTQLIYKLCKYINESRIYIECSLHPKDKQALNEELELLEAWKNEKDGKLKCTPKEEYKKQLRRSPDFLEALAYRMIFEIFNTDFVII